MTEENSNTSDKNAESESIEIWHPVYPFPPIIPDLAPPVLGDWDITQIDSDTIKVSWDPAEDAKGEVVMYEVRCNGKSEFLPADFTEVPFYHLDSFKAQVSIRVLDDAGNISKWQKKTFTLSDWVEPSRVTTKTELVNLRNQSVKLRWERASDNSGKIAYYEVMLGSGETFQTTKTTLVLKHLGIGTSETYQVRAVDKAGNCGEWSKESSFFIADIAAPKNGKVFVTQQDNSTVLVSWTSATDNSGTVAGYKIICNGIVKTLTADENMVSFEDVSGSRAAISFQAFDETGNYSKKINKTLKLKDRTAPEQVTLAAEILDNKKYKVKLCWDRATDNSGKIAYYEILLSDGRLLKTSKTFLSVKKLRPDTEYTYQVRAVDKAGNIGEWSDSSSFYTEDATAPTKVRIKAKKSFDSLHLSWKPAKDNVGVIAYTLRYGSHLENSILLDASETEYLLEDLPFGTVRYQITACDAAGNESIAAGGKVNINIIRLEAVPIVPIYHIMNQTEDLKSQITGFENSEYELSEALSSSSDIIGTAGNETLKIESCSTVSIKTLDLGLGTDTLILGKNSQLFLHEIKGVERINGEEGAAIYSCSEFDFSGVSGSWRNIDLFHYADLNSGKGSLYANEQDIYRDVTGTISFNTGDDHSEIRAEIFTDGIWKELSPSNGTGIALENAMIRVGITGDFDRTEKKCYEFTLA